MVTRREQLGTSDAHLADEGVAPKKGKGKEEEEGEGKGKGEANPRRETKKNIRRHLRKPNLKK